MSAKEGSADAGFVSHPPTRPLPQPTRRPREKGPSYFVDAVRGKDTQNGAERSPWRTVTRAFDALKAGDTLYLRGGTCYENLTLSLHGKPGAPITIRSFPGELAVIDGGLREFFESPSKSWEPCPGGAPGEYRSVRAYPNLRHVHGWFGDSMIALQIYHYRKDLQAATDEFLLHADKPVDPYHVGPGVWYDTETGHIHARLPHTSLNFDYPGVADYRGTTDPRKVPLVIAPFRSVPLCVDDARHIRFQDLVVRGGGFDTVVLQGAQHVEFDNVVVYCGTYGLRGRYSGHVRFHNSALRGGVPPWGVLEDGALREHHGLPIPALGRNIARLTAHALAVMEGHTEEQVYYYPLNHDWEFSYSDFTDGHDGIYFGGERIRFHHNRVDRIMDDQLYLSPLTMYALGKVYIYQNLFTCLNMTFGFGGLTMASRLDNKPGSYAHLPDGNIYIFRNIIDHRQGILPGRKGTERGVRRELNVRRTNNFVIHGGHPNIIGPLHVYQNTFISPVGPGHVGIQDRARTYAQSTLFYASTHHPRRVFNNLFVYLEGMFPMATNTLPTIEEDVQIDGNLHWDIKAEKSTDPGFFNAFRATPLFEATKARYAPGWEANALVADPKLTAFDPHPRATNDYRLQADSPAKGAGIVLPAEWEDPLRPRDGRPDIGAYPVGEQSWSFGRDPSRVPAMP